MRLRHIEVIQAILETGSLTAAASLLHISQPAVSKTLQHAELQAGYVLFKRVKGRLVATPEMIALTQEISALSDNLQRIRDLAKNLQGKINAPLRVICTPTLANSVLPCAIRLWRTSFPDNHCALATQHSENIQRALLLRDFDLGLTLQPPLHPAISSRCIAEGNAKVIAPEDYWPPQITSLRIESLAGQPLTGLDAQDPIGKRLNSKLENLSPQPKIRTRVQTYQLQLSMVASGEGLAVVDPFTASMASQLGLSQATLVPEVKIGLYAWWRDDLPLQAHQEHFLKALKRTAADLLK